MGRCLFGDAKIVDENNETLDFGEIGELLFSAPTMMEDYLVGKAPFVEDDGIKWFPTGDLAKISPKGEFEVIGRKKNIIISGGRNIYPEEINNILLEEKSIVECATFSIPDKNWENGHGCYHYERRRRHNLSIHYESTIRKTVPIKFLEVSRVSEFPKIGLVKPI